MTIALRIDPEDQTVDPGRQAVFTIHVVNQSGVVDRVAIDILGSAGEWSVTDPQAVALFPGTDATASLVITPPLGTPLGPVPLGVRATAETSGYVEVGEANLNVGASRTVEAELRPRTATGKRRATSVIVLHNLGNAPTKVSVVATDPDDAIVFDAPSAIQIGPGQIAELPLRMRLPSREKQGATLPYQVLVEGGETGQSLDGQVRQPAKKRWPIMAAMLGLALIAAAVLYLRPEDAKPIAGGAADEPITTTVPGATTVTTAAAAAPAGGAPAADPAAAAAAAAAGGAAAAAPGAAAPGGAAAPAGGAATTAKPAAQGNTGPAAIVPTTATTKPPLNCGNKGTAQQTAQRVICAWEKGRLPEVADSFTANARQTLIAMPPPAVGTQKASPANADGIVTFTGCAPGKGVSSVKVVPSGTSNVVDVPITPC